MKLQLTHALCAALLAVLAAAAHAAGEPFEWRTATAGENLTATLRVAPGFYVYADTLTLLPGTSGGAVPVPTSSPTPTTADDGAGGTVNVFREGEWSWSFHGTPPFTLSVEFNGCRIGAPGAPPFCLPPVELQLLPAPESAAKREAEELAGEVLDVGALTSGFQPAKTLIGAVSKEEFLRWLDGGEQAAKADGAASSAAGFLGLLLAALLGGLALNLTPCVLPLIPVNLIIIGASGSGRRTGFQRGFACGAGMALAYGAVGAAVVLAGAHFGELNSSSVFNFIVAGIFFVLAAAMAGIFHLDPGAWLRRFAPFRRGGQPPNAGGLWVAAAMGVLSALLAGACVAPAVIAVLLLAAARSAAGETWAILLPFCLGIGMALPWPFAGMGLAVLPRPGRFMVRIKYLLAAVIAGVGVWYCHLGIGLLPGRGHSVAAEVAGLNSALVRGREEGKPVVVDFWAKWCANCREFDRGVLADPEVKSRLAKVVFLRFRVDRMSDPEVKELMKAWQIPGFPAVVLLEPAK